MNIPPTIGMAISHDPSLIGPLSTTLGIEDLHDLIEVIRVDAHNRILLEKWRKQNEDRGR